MEMHVYTTGLDGAARTQSQIGKFVAYNLKFFLVSLRVYKERLKVVIA